MRLEYAPHSSMTSSMQPAPTQGLTEFELQRQARIKRNRQVLCDLGLENAAEEFSMPQPKKQKQQASKNQQQQLVPTRQSRRQRGDGPELEVLGSRRR